MLNERAVNEIKTGYTATADMAYRHGLVMNRTRQVRVYK